MNALKNSAPSKSGMMWMETDPKLDLKTKLSQALAYCQNKYQSLPQKIEINPRECPSDLSALMEIFPEIEISSDQYILPCHYFLHLEILEEDLKTEFFPS